jgi:hypothetical protein
MKRCFKCQQVKNLDEFYRHPAMGDGRLGKCKECAKADVQKNYRTNHTYYKDYDKQRQRTLKRREQQRMSRRNEARDPERYAEYKKRWTERNPEKRKAHHAVSNAIRDGKLHRQPCEVCGETKAEAHHDDYSRPLKVRWLCNLHHHTHGHGHLEPKAA